jgi:hypothetical protein
VKTCFIGYPTFGGNGWVIDDQGRQEQIDFYNRLKREAEIESPQTSQFFHAGVYFLNFKVETKQQ